MIQGHILGTCFIPYHKTLMLHFIPPKHYDYNNMMEFLFCDYLAMQIPI